MANPFDFASLQQALNVRTLVDIFLIFLCSFRIKFYHISIFIEEIQEY